MLELDHTLYALTLTPASEKHLSERFTSSDSIISMALAAREICACNIQISQIFNFASLLEIYSLYFLYSIKGEVAVSFPSPAKDYIERTLTIKILCGVTANSIVIETSHRFAG